MNVLKIYKRLPKRQKILTLLFIFVVFLGISTFIIALVTGKNKPSAAGENQIVNTAYITYDGLSNPIASNTVTVQIENINPNLIEAENMTLNNFEVNAYSWASGGNVIRLTNTAGITGNASTNYAGVSGTYDIKVYYNDESDGACRFKLYIDGNLIDEWVADQNLGITDPQLGNLVNRTKTGVTVNNNSQIKIEVVQDSNEWGRIDKIELTPSQSQNTTLNINITLPSGTDFSTSGGNLSIYQSGTTNLVGGQDNLSTDSAGDVSIQTNLTSGSFDFKLVVPGYLVKIIRNITLSDPLDLDFGTLKAGDLDGDNNVGLSDFILFRNHWLESDPLADFDHDNKVTLSDFITLRANWLQEGDK